MASIFKRKRQWAIPKGAKIIKQKGGKRIAKWTDGRGRSRKATVVTNSKGEDRIELEDTKWSIAYTTASGKRRIITGAPDKQATMSIARKLESTEAEYRHGSRNEQHEHAARESAKPIKKHLDAFERKMSAEHRADAYIDGTMSILKRFCDAQKVSSISQLSADRVHKYADKLRAEGMTPRTVHAHLTALKSFTKWLLVTGKLPTDPLVSIKKPSPTRKQERRFVLPDEFPLLLKAARSGPERFGMCGEERGLLYDFAVQTGLRLGEIRSLTVADLHLDEKQPYVRCKAGSTKNRKAAQQYLLPHLAAKLKNHVERKLPSAPVFQLPADRKRAPQMLREDMEAARVAWLGEMSNKPKAYRKREQSDFLKPTNNAGQVLDFHALRHTCGAWASMTGASPKAVQTLMRHSSIMLTLDTYGHLMPDEAAGTVQRLAMFYPKQHAG